MDNVYQQGRGDQEMHDQLYNQILEIKSDKRSR